MLCVYVYVLHLEKCNKQQPKNDLLRIETLQDSVNALRELMLYAIYKYIINNAMPCNEYSIRTCIIYYNGSADKNPHEKKKLELFP